MSAEQRILDHRMPIRINLCVLFFLDICLLQLAQFGSVDARKHRSVPERPRGHDSIIRNSENDKSANSANSAEFIWSTQTVATGDTAVLHCSFDAIFAQLRNGNIDWVREFSVKAGETSEPPQLLATGKKVVVADRRYRVYRPHNSALSVLIIRRAKKRDAGIFRCNLSGSSTRHKYLNLNVTESKFVAETSPATLRARVGKDVTLWCNVTGYPKPIVYWTREDRNRKLPDGNYQYWGNGLTLKRATEQDTGIYACFLDNFVQPVVSYKFSIFVEDSPWEIDGYKMRFDSSRWYKHDDPEPKPVKAMSYLLMCETRGSPKPLPHIHWFKNGKQVKNNKHFYIIEDRPEWRTSYTSSTLVIMRFVPRFQANYTCVASNVFRVKTQTFMITGYLEKEAIDYIEDVFDDDDDDDVEKDEGKDYGASADELASIRIDAIDKATTKDVQQRFKLPRKEVAPVQEDYDGHGSADGALNGTTDDEDLNEGEDEGSADDQEEDAQ